jgi:hypothetical protein
MFAGALLRAAFTARSFRPEVVSRGLFGERERSDSSSDESSGDRAGGNYFLLGGGGARFSLGPGLTFDSCVFLSITL